MKLSQIFTKAQSGHTLLTLLNLKWVTFLEVMQTQKNFLLDANYSENKKYSESDYKLFSDYWMQLQDHAYEIEGSYESKDLIKKGMNRLLLIEQIKLMEKDTNLLVSFASKRPLYMIADKLADYDKNIQSIYAMIKRHDKRIKIKYFEGVDVNVKIMERIIASLINEYNTSDTVIDKKVKKQQISGVREVIQVNRVLGTKLVYTEMSVMEWLEAKKLAKEEATPKVGETNPQVKP
jgi:hypothetical protein